jgi:hypothetical protein
MQLNHETNERHEVFSATSATFCKIWIAVFWGAYS